MGRKTLAVLIFAAQVCLTACACAEGEKEYTVGVDDIIEINILQPEKLSTTVTVSPDGSISFPYIGNVFVKGLGLSQIKQEIETKLTDGYMKYPVISVVLKESRSRKFFVYGDVAKPGSYPVEDNTTVLKAIAIAGGFSKNGSFSRVKVLRPKSPDAGYTAIEVNVKSVLQGKADADMRILSGDTIMVSEGKFFVYGDVARPGAYPMEEDTTVLKAISMAGGLNKYASSGSVQLLRPKKDGTGYETIDINVAAVMKGESAADTVLLPNDTVMVSEGKFFVYGEVNKPGVYSLENDTTVLKAIAIAGGFSKFGSSSRVKVLRPRLKGAGYETLRVNIKDLMDGSGDEDIILKPGDTVVVMEGVF